jgi:hypothetical protein
MEPRLVFRTHYQVDEPAYLGVLIEEAASPTRSDYPERVAERLVKALQKRGARFNIAAAGYGVDLARSLGLINAQQVWTPLGHLVHLFTEQRTEASPEELALSDLEKLVYFRVFLEGDGAAIIFLAQYLSTHESIPGVDGADWNHVAWELVTWCFSEYLRLTSAPADRVALRRELERVRRRAYKGRTGEHKLFVHLRTMTRLGLIDERNGSGRRRYVGDVGVLDVLRTRLDDVVYLELVVKEQRWPDVVSCLQPSAQPLAVSDEWIRPSVARYYLGITKTGVALCPIGTLVDAVIVEHLGRGQLVSAADVREWLGSQVKDSSRRMRIHVDRSGTSAYLKLDAELVAEWAS